MLEFVGATFGILIVLILHEIDFLTVHHPSPFLPLLQCVSILLIQTGD